MISLIRKLLLYTLYIYRHYIVVYELLALVDRQGQQQEASYQRAILLYLQYCR